MWHVSKVVNIFAFNVCIYTCSNYSRQPYAGSNSYRESLLGIMDDIKD